MKQEVDANGGAGRDESREPRSRAWFHRSGAASSSTIRLCEKATAENFDEEGYAYINPAVLAAAGGDPDYLRHHLLNHGIREGRSQINRRALA